MSTTTAPTAELTVRQQQILNFIYQHIDDHGWPPTVREIGAEMEISSPNGVMCHLKALKKKDRIEMEDHKSRCIRISGHAVRVIPPHLIERVDDVLGGYHLKKTRNRNGRRRQR